MTKYLLTGIAVLASATAVTAAAQTVPDAKIAVVDIARLLSDCTACKAANTQLQAQQTQLRSQAQTLAAPLETERQSIQTALQAAKGNPDAALQARINAFQTKGQTVQQQLAQGEQTLERNLGYVRQQIGTRAQPIIQQIAQQRGATIAMDKGGTIFAAPTVDITDAVLAQLNSQLPSVSVTAPAGPAPTSRPNAPQGR